MWNNGVHYIYWTRKEGMVIWLVSSAVGGMVVCLERFAVGYTAAYLVSSAVEDTTGLLQSLVEEYSTAAYLGYFVGNVERVVNVWYPAGWNTDIQVVMLVGVLENTIARWAMCLTSCNCNLKPD